MSETDFERLTRLMLGEFKGVNERFDVLDNHHDYLLSQFNSIEAELRDIRLRLTALEEAVENASGFAKEIDHLLKRLSLIEKHLGLETHIRA